MKHLITITLVAGIALSQSTPLSPEDEAVAIILKLEGTVTRDTSRPGQPVVGINL